MFGRRAEPFADRDASFPQPSTPAAPEPEIEDAFQQERRPVMPDGAALGPESLDTDDTLEQALARGAVAIPGDARIEEPAPPPQPAPRKTAAARLPANDRSQKGQAGDFQPSRAPELSDRYLAARKLVFEDIRQGVDVTALVRLDRERARQDIETAVETIINFRRLDLTGAEQFSLIREVCDDILGYGPLEPLLARDDIADIMVNGPDTVYIETKGRIERAPIRFRDNQHLVNICQKIVSAVGRRIDESSPICDARLPDGSRVNAIIPPLAVDGATLTIRKFKQDKLTLDKLIEYGSVSPAAATVLRVAAACRCNILVSGGTGSGKTTMLNCLTGYISPGERVITCEDACELQLQ